MSSSSSALAFELASQPATDLASGLNTVAVPAGVAESTFHSTPSSSDAASTTTFVLALGKDSLLAADSVVVNVRPKFIFRYNKPAAANATPTIIPGATPNAWAFSNLGLLRAVESVTLQLGGRSIERRIPDLLPLMSACVPYDRAEDASSLATPDIFAEPAGYFYAAGAEGAGPFGTGRTGYYQPRHLPGTVIESCDENGTIIAPEVYPWVGAAGETRYVAVTANMQMRLPFEIFGDGLPGLAHLSQVQVNIVWRQDFARCFTMIPAAGVNVESVRMPRFAAMPVMEWQAIRAKDHVVEACGAATQVYPVMNYQLVSRGYALTGVNAAATSEVSTSAEILSTVPKYLAIYCARDLSMTSGAMTANAIVGSTNHNAKISALEVRIGNSVAFTSLSYEGLVRLSQRNGMSLSALECGRVGNVILLDVEKDLGVGAAFIGQSNANMSLQVTARLSGTHAGAAAANYTFTVARVEQAFLSTSPAGVSYDLGVSLDEDQQRALMVHDGNVIARSNKRLVGGSFFGALRGIASRFMKALPALKAAAPHVWDAVKSVAGAGYGPQVSAGGLAPPPKKTTGARRGRGIDVAEPGAAPTIL